MIARDEEKLKKLDKQTVYFIAEHIAGGFGKVTSIFIPKFIYCYCMFNNRQDS